MKGLKKLPLAIAISSVMAATAQAELKALEDEVMSEMTGQSGITIEMEMQAEVGAVTYTDEGSIRLEGITLDNDGGALNQTIEIDMIEKSDLAAGPGAATKAAGDIIKVGISSMEMDVQVDAIRTGDASAASLGQLNLEDVAMSGTDMYVYALDGKKGIGVDAIVNQSIGRVSFRDVDVASDGTVTNGALDGGTIALNDISISTLDMTGTEITIVDGAENAFGTNDAVKINMPGINDGTISIGGIQIGSATDDSYDQFNQTIGAVELDGLTLAGTEMYVYAPDTGSGIRVTQTMNVSLDEVTYVSGVLDSATAAKSADAIGAALTAQGLNDYANAAAAQAAFTTAQSDLGNYQAMGTQQAIIDDEIANNGVVEADSNTHTAAYTNAIAARDTAAGNLSGNYANAAEATLDANSAGARLTAQYPAADNYYGNGGSRTGDGVGSLTLSNVSFTADQSTVAIDVLDGGSTDQLVIDAPMTNANISIGAINVGDGNLGGLAISGLNMTTNSISVYAH